MLGCVAVCLFGTASVQAQPDSPGACASPALAPVIASPPDRSKAPVTIMAEALDAGANTLGTAIGQVELFRADQYLSTEVVHYRPQTGLVSLPSPLIYQDSQLRLEASSGMFGTIEESGDFRDVDFSLVGSSAHGEAELVQICWGQPAPYSNVPGSPPARATTRPGASWPSELELRHDEGVGCGQGRTPATGQGAGAVCTLVQLSDR